MQQKVWEKNQALKTWTFFFSSLHSTCSSSRRSIIVPSTFVHGRDHESTDYRVVQSGIFLFTTPFERLLVYVKLVTTYIQLPSSTADDARWLKTRKLTSSKSFARILLQSYTLCYYRLIISLIPPFHFVFLGSICCFYTVYILATSLYTENQNGLHTEARLKHKLKWRQRRFARWFAVAMGRSICVDAIT